MKKLILSALALTLSLSGTILTKASAYENINKNDVLVAYVEDEPITTPFVNLSKGEKYYSLDFSCLNIVVKNGKILSDVNYKKINNVAKAKNFSKEKKNRLENNAIKTKLLLENELDNIKIHTEINEIIQQHYEKTSTAPVIGVTQAPVEVSANESVTSPLSITSPLVTTMSQSGKTESNSYVRIYTSVSGSGSTAWGQSNAYIPSPSIVGASINCPDAISLSWDSPWRLTDNYALTLVDSGGATIPSWLKARTRVPGSNNCLAFQYTQHDVKGSYLGASLADGTSGGHNLFSTYVHTYLTLAYSFSAQSGQYGLSVSPSQGTSSVQSSVYFTR